MEIPKLPNEIWIEILARLDGRTLRLVSLVNHLMYDLSNLQEVWKRLCLKDGYSEPASLITDLSESSKVKEKMDWKRLYIHYFRIKERNALFDFVTLTISKESLFGKSLKLNLPHIPQTLQSICHQWQDSQPNQNQERGKSKFSSILWTNGISDQHTDKTRKMLYHNLNVGQKRYSMVPKRFILDYHQKVLWDPVYDQVDLSQLIITSDRY
ncbi:hypothetical protein BC833DRAFT_608749 [Globomyces pollinis-pini]|nr:hypothetical protein BC833DRAFT_608749 [Globomyces pollinis-pini]